MNTYAENFIADLLETEDYRKAIFVLVDLIREQDGKIKGLEEKIHGAK